MSDDGNDDSGHSDDSDSENENENDSDSDSDNDNDNDSDNDLRELLSAAHAIAVVGLSDSPSRPSFGVAAYLMQAGYRVVPVNPRLTATSVLGEPVFARLEDIPFAIDIVDVFRREEEVPLVAAGAVAIRARCLWQQQGIASAEGDRIARRGGLLSVMDRCLKIEHARLGVPRRTA